MIARKLGNGAQMEVKKTTVVASHRFISLVANLTGNPTSFGTNHNKRITSIPPAVKWGSRGTASDILTLYALYLIGRNIVQALQLLNCAQCLPKHRWCSSFSAVLFWGCKVLVLVLLAPNSKTWNTWVVATHFDEKHMPNCSSIDCTTSTHTHSPRNRVHRELLSQDAELLRHITAIGHCLAHGQDCPQCREKNLTSCSLKLMPHLSNVPKIFSANCRAYKNNAPV